MVFYLDTSALVKLVVREDETVALRHWVEFSAGAPARELVTSDLTRTELMRAARRVDPALAPAARAVLDALTVVSLATGTFEAAGRLESSGLRSLDAVHLAIALELGDDLEGFVCYDDRLAAAAAEYGVVVLAPR